MWFKIFKESDKSSGAITDKALKKVKDVEFNSIDELWEFALNEHKVGGYKVKDNLGIIQKLKLTNIAIPQKIKNKEYEVVYPAIEILDKE